MTLAIGPHGVDGAEARGGQGEEDSWVLGDAVRNAFPAFEPRTDQMPSVAAVDLGARRASHRISRSACLEDHSIWQGSAREADTAPTVPGGEGVATQADRMAAPTAAVPLAEELIDPMLTPVAAQGFKHGVVSRIHAGEGGSEV
jgi:hypothetical protein